MPDRPHARDFSASNEGESLRAGTVRDVALLTRVTASPLARLSQELPVKLTTALHALGGEFTGQLRLHPRIGPVR